MSELDTHRDAILNIYKILNLLVKKLDSLEGSNPPSRPRLVVNKSNDEVTK